MKSIRIRWAEFVLSCIVVAFITVIGGVLLSVLSFSKTDEKLLPTIPVTWTKSSPLAAESSLQLNATLMWCACSTLTPSPTPTISPTASRTATIDRTGTAFRATDDAQIATLVATFTYTETPGATLSALTDTPDTPTQEFLYTEACVKTNITELNVRRSPLITGTLVGKAMAGRCYQIDNTREFTPQVTATRRYIFVPIFWTDGSKAWVASTDGVTEWIVLK